jgi:hypothetical protein
MRRFLALVALLLASSADPAGFGRGGGLTCPKGYIGGGLTPCVPVRVAFEFAPAGGTGMGAACACAAVTGANGEALAMTRGSNATCSRQGAATTGIAPGDLVTCANNLPRVEPVASGLGYLREGAATNVNPRSAEIDDASYGDFTANGAAAPVLNGVNAALAPDNALAAEDYTFAATGATQASARAIAVLTAAAYSAQVWVRGVSGSGATDLCITTSGTPTATCSTCAFTSASWTQCKVEGVTSIASGQIYLGNMSYLNGGTTRAANRVYVWGLDAEAGAFASSYVPTAGATATRSADSALTGYASTTWGPDFSLASTVAFVATSASSTTAAQLGSAAPNLAAVKTTNNTTAAYTINATSSGPTVTAMGSASHRTALADALGTRGAWWDTTSVAAPAASITSTFNGAVDTDVTYVTGKLGQAASFNGSTSKIVTAVNGPLGAAAWSISMWAYRNTLATQTGLFQWGDGAGTSAYAFCDSGTIYIHNGVTATTKAFASNAWQHVVVAYDGTTVSIYINNSAPTSAVVAFNSSAGVIILGSLRAANAHFGLIDDTCMWDRALTAGEVASLYNAGAGVETMTGSLLTGLLHQWRLNGSSVDQLGQASLTIGALNARTSAVCADPNPSRCR